jgi:hypothetical protein
LKGMLAADHATISRVQNVLQDRLNNEGGTVTVTKRDMLTALGYDTSVETTFLVNFLRPIGPSTHHASKLALAKELDAKLSKHAAAVAALLEECVVADAAAAATAETISRVQNVLQDRLNNEGGTVTKRDMLTALGYDTSVETTFLGNFLRPSTHPSKLALAKELDAKLSKHADAVAAIPRTIHLTAGKEQPEGAVTAKESSPPVAVGVAGSEFMGMLEHAESGDDFAARAAEAPATGTGRRVRALPPLPAEVLVQYEGGGGGQPDYWWRASVIAGAITIDRDCVLLVQGSGADGAFDVVALSDAAVCVPGGRGWDQAAKQLAREQAQRLAKQESQAAQLLAQEQAQKLVKQERREEDDERELAQAHGQPPPGEEGDVARAAAAAAAAAAKAAQHEAAQQLQLKNEEQERARSQDLLVKQEKREATELGALRQQHGEGAQQGKRAYGEAVVKLEQLSPQQQQPQPSKRQRRAQTGEKEPTSQLPHVKTEEEQEQSESTDVRALQQQFGRELPHVKTEEEQEQSESADVRALQQQHGC